MTIISNLINIQIVSNIAENDLNDGIIAIK